MVKEDKKQAFLITSFNSSSSLKEDDFEEYKREEIIIGHTKGKAQEFILNELDKHSSLFINFREKSISKICSESIKDSFKKFSVKLQTKYRVYHNFRIKTLDGEYLDYLKEYKPVKNFRIIFDEDEELFSNYNYFEIYSIKSEDKSIGKLYCNHCNRTEKDFFVNIKHKHECPACQKGRIIRESVKIMKEENKLFCGDFKEILNFLRNPQKEELENDKNFDEEEKEKRYISKKSMWQIYNRKRPDFIKIKLNDLKTEIESIYIFESKNKEISNLRFPDIRQLSEYIIVFREAVEKKCPAYLIYNGELDEKIMKFINEKGEFSNWYQKINFKLVKLEDYVNSSMRLLNISFSKIECDSITDFRIIDKKQSYSYVNHIYLIATKKYMIRYNSTGKLP